MTYIIAQTMTFDKFLILSSTSPITTAQNPSPKTIEFLAKMFTDNATSKELCLIRMQFKLPENGFDITPHIGQNLKDISPINNEFVFQSLEIVANELGCKFGLGYGFAEAFMLLIFFNAFLDVESIEAFTTQSINFIVGKKNISGELFAYPQEVGAILIPYNISQNRLISWIKENWDKIGKGMEENLSTNPYVLKMHKNTGLALEIINLKEEEKRSFSKIATILSAKYPDNDKLPSEEYIKKLYYDYKELYPNLLIQPTKPPSTK